MAVGANSVVVASGDTLIAFSLETGERQRQMSSPSNKEISSIAGKLASLPSLSLALHRPQPPTTHPCYPSPPFPPLPLPFLPLHPCPASPCGLFVFAAAGNRTVTKYEISTLGLIAQSQPVFDDFITHLCHSGSSTNTRSFVLAVGGDNSWAAVLDDTDLTVVSKKKKLHAVPIEHAAISTSGGNIVTVCKAPARKQAMKLFDQGFSEKHKIKPPHENLVNGLIFSPVNDDKFYSYAQDCAIKSWSFSKRCTLQLVANAHSANITCLMLSNDGTRMVSSSADNFLILWDPETNSKITSLDVAEPLADLTFCTANSAQIVTLGKSGSVHAWKESQPDINIDLDIKSTLNNYQRMSTTESLKAIHDQKSLGIMHLQSISGKDLTQRRTSFGARATVGEGIAARLTVFERGSMEEAPPELHHQPARVQHPRIDAVQESPLLGPRNPPGTPPTPEQTSKDRALDALAQDISLTKDELSLTTGDLTKTKSELHAILAENEHLKQQCARLSKELNETNAAKDIVIKQQDERILNMQYDVHKMQSELHEQWANHHETVLTAHADETNRWRSHSESLQAAQRHEKEEVEKKLREDEELFKKHKESFEAHSSELTDEVRTLRKMLIDEEKVKLDFQKKVAEYEEKEMTRETAEMGTVQKMVEEILKQCRVLNSKTSQERIEKRIVDLAVALEKAFHFDKKTSSTLLENVRRQKVWEKDEKSRLVHDIRSLVLEAEIAHVYQRSEAVKDIEELRKRTEKELTALLERLRGEEKAMLQAKKKFGEFHEEIVEVDKVVNKYLTEINDLRTTLATLSISNGAQEMHRVQAKISDLSIELQAWTDLKRDFNLALTKQDMLYRKLKSNRDNTHRTYHAKKNTFDEGIGLAFDEAIEIVADADEQEAIRRRELRQEEEREKMRILSSQKNVDRQLEGKEAVRKKELRKHVSDLNLSIDPLSYSSPMKGNNPNSPGAMIGTLATWARIRDKAQGRNYDFDFSDYLSKDGKKNTVPFKPSMQNSPLLNPRPTDRMLLEGRVKERDEGSMKTILTTLKNAL
jgi:hypothetical protein